MSKRVRYVVTAIIEDQAGKVLWLRRSSQVKSYPGYWSAISGGINPGASLVSEALREIHEETGLSASWRHTATPFVFIDPNEGEFHITPLLFRVSGEPAPRLNWESEAAEWARETPPGPRVPALGESLRRARGGSVVTLAAPLLNRLRSFANDRTQGASRLAAEAARLFADCLPALQSLDPDTQRLTARGLAVWLQEVHPTMPGISNTLADSLAALASVPNLETIAESSRASARALEEARSTIAAQARNWLGAGPWLTISRSSLVEEAARAAGVHLRVLESLPLGEGRTLAAVRRSEALAVSLYPDTAMAEAARDCSAIVFGADALLPGGDILNKLGSFPLALCARALNIPCWVLAESAKQTDTQPLTRLVEGPHAVPGADEAVSVPLFERVPRSYLAGVLTEQGFWLGESQTCATTEPYLLWESL
jgi:translation initiation factor 2B subunit (eIF-2B alpha/beta/delta family)/8-oxo-dGTP pyrophosphatase MutT (NUDIX family)